MNMDPYGAEWVNVVQTEDKTRDFYEASDF